MARAAAEPRPVALAWSAARRDCAFQTLPCERAESKSSKSSRGDVAPPRPLPSTCPPQKLSSSRQRPGSCDHGSRLVVELDQQKVLRITPCVRVPTNGSAHYVRRYSGGCRQDDRCEQLCAHSGSLPGSSPQRVRITSCRLAPSAFASGRPSEAARRRRSQSVIVFADGQASEKPGIGAAGTGCGLSSHSTTDANRIGDRNGTRCPRFAWGEHVIGAS